MEHPNPIISGFFPDPSVCRVGADFYLATSSFTYAPGVPIFRSRDLVNWTQIGNALDRPEQLDLGATSAWSSMGIYAPTLRYHDGRFWMITASCTSTGVHKFLVSAENPAGPWSDPVPIVVGDAFGGIDPDLAWDADGRCWMHYAKSGVIERCQIDPRTGEVIRGPEPTWSGTGLQHPEAPHVFARDGIWYLLIAEGGTERGHCVSIARGPSLLGPWESCPVNPILSHRSTDSPVQSTGHADMVEAADGSWWMVLLGTRPRGMTPGWHVLGRETFLTRVDWLDGWPLVSAVSLTVDVDTPPPDRCSSDLWRDDFDSTTLDPGWIAVRRAPTAISSLTRRPGWITLLGTAGTLDGTEPDFVGRRQQHPFGRVRARVELAGATEAGLAVVMDEHHHYEAGLTSDRVIVRARIGPLTAVVAEAPHPGRTAVLVIETRPDFFGPDRIVLGFEDDDGTMQVLADLDGRYLSTEVAGGFIGRVIGMYTFGATAAFDWFEVEPA